MLGRNLVLLTGATGLLGRYLLRDLFATGNPVAVIARSSRNEPAADRIETVMNRWERLEGRALPRPVILEGDLTQPGLGLSADNRQLLKEQCSRVIHSAASLYYSEKANGEPLRSNLEGTKHLVELCKETNISELHHISTAYIAGMRTGRVYETELDVGQEYCNIYEYSKCEAEKVVRNSGIESVTVYRPAIIVGDSRTGYTNTYHGFYAPFRLTHMMATKLPVQDLELTLLLEALGLKGTECKNFITVDWVAQALVRIFNQPNLHGSTYHLTSSNPLPVSKLLDAGREVFGNLYQPSDPPLNIRFEDLMPLFREQLKTYEEHWRHDAFFDRTNIEAALPDFPCPTFNVELVSMLVRAAAADNFGFPPEKILPADNRLHRLFAMNGFRAPADSFNSNPNHLGLQITGRGGGWWKGTLQAGAFTNVCPGIAPPQACQLRLAATTLDAICKQELSPLAALDSGRVVVTGNHLSKETIAQALQKLGAAINDHQTH